MAYHAGYLAREQEFGAYLILDMVMLFIAREDVPGRDSLSAGRGSAEVIEFDAGYIIPALFWRRREMEANFGMLVRSVPRTGLDSAGIEVSCSFSRCGTASSST